MNCSLQTSSAQACQEGSKTLSSHMLAGLFGGRFIVLQKGVVPCHWEFMTCLAGTRLYPSPRVQLTLKGFRGRETGAKVLRGLWPSWGERAHSDEINPRWQTTGVKHGSRRAQHFTEISLCLGFLEWVPTASCFVAIAPEGKAVECVFSSTQWTCH